jgi:hypothetical protein
MRIYPQEQHPDLGLVDFDETEDLRPTKNAPGRCANTAEGDSNHHHANEEF